MSPNVYGNFGLGLYTPGVHKKERTNNNLAVQFEGFVA